MARRFSTPKGDGNQTVPITARRIKRATLDKVKAFITEDDVKDDDGNITGTKMRPKLALYWNSGFIQRNKDNDPVYDEAGAEQTHYIVDGFLAVSGFRTSNMVKNVLPALGIEGDAFIHPDGEKKGNLKDDEFGFTFGKNALGEDFSGITSLEELPEYKRGGKARKGEVECEVTSWMVYDEDGNGYELIGRAVELELTVDGDWNRIKSYMLPEDFAGLDAEAPGAAKPAPAKPGKAAGSGDPTEPPPTTAHAKYVSKVLDLAEVAPISRVELLRYVTGDGTITSVAGISVAAAKTLKQLFTAADEPTSGTTGVQMLQEALATVEGSATAAMLADDAEWGEEEDFPAEADLPF